jgi:hypothetical protein
MAWPCWRMHGRARPCVCCMVSRGCLRSLLQRVQIAPWQLNVTGPLSCTTAVLKYVMVLPPVCVLLGHMHDAVSFVVLALHVILFVVLELHGLFVCWTAMPEGVCLWSSLLANSKAC